MRRPPLDLGRVINEDNNICRRPRPSYRPSRSSSSPRPGARASWRHSHSHSHHHRHSFAFRGGGGRFSSSIVTHPADDHSLGLLESLSLATEGRRRHERRRCDRGDDDVRGRTTAMLVYATATARRGCFARTSIAMIPSLIAAAMTRRSTRGDGRNVVFRRWSSVRRRSVATRSVGRTGAPPLLVAGVAIAAANFVPSSVRPRHDVARRDRFGSEPPSRDRRRRGTPASSSWSSTTAFISIIADDAGYAQDGPTAIVALLAENSTVLILAADTRQSMREAPSNIEERRGARVPGRARTSRPWRVGRGTRFGGRVGRPSRGTEGSAMRWTTTTTTMMTTAATTATATIATTPSSADMTAAWAVPLPPNDIAKVPRRPRSESPRWGGTTHFRPAPCSPRCTPTAAWTWLSYSALGSGGLAAMGVLESRYPRSSSLSSLSSLSSSSSSCTVAEGMRLAVDAVRAGIENDLGSGSQVDVCVIGRGGGVFYRRAVAREEELTWKTKLDGRNDSDDAPDGVTLCGAGDGADGDIPRMSSSRKNDAGGENDIGVNGFGNVPFAIQSKRVVCDHHAKRERDRWLDEVMCAE